ncbi:MAG: hypothetical protein R3360_06380 [Alphaproteobacteria bacterium]|nr:hypothetical protein [Alphaproteobacteria bacterium]
MLCFSSPKPGFAAAMLGGALLAGALGACSQDEAEPPAFSALCRDYVAICECQASALEENLGEEDRLALRRAIYNARQEQQQGDPAAPEAVALDAPLSLRRAYFDAILACAEPRSPL